ncbi:hypothetical protein SOM46_26225 [Pseudomonas fluorescens]|uniref:hypothetical protein n=1 Tax=Pseudomonas fluorescens TaxID=294 RepID=UPI00177D539A|nr:hypothetical protein [Pseudomonas fluorescens]MBD8239518.1 hypothetical protein [Pseudomonas fluorescens]MDY0898437.1 hypothetical protein [Pseudomonas fluorescens]
MHTTKTADFMKLPVVLTPGAWQEAVHLENAPDTSAISNRLSDVVWMVYRELHLQPDSTSLNFGLYRLLPSGESHDRYWLDLKVERIESPPGASYLYVSLKEETHTSCP